MKNNVHLICNAHLDPVWQWRWTEGCSEAIATFRNAVEIIGEYPELIFNHNESILYEWVKKYDARLFRQIRELVEQKRWFISGGWFLQPDLNLPPYENLVRHIQFGRDFFKSEFGVEPKVAYNFDSFGHPAGLPGLLRDFGYELYIHQRPEKEFLNLPDSLYRWKGLDNKSIPAYRIEIGLYHTERKNMTQRMAEATSLSVKLGRDVALFWGLGDHGGGATRADLDRIREFTANEKQVNFIHSTTDRFYEAIKPIIPELPVYEGSLQRVFTGCYTSLSRIKRKAVEASAAAIQAERLVETFINVSVANVNTPAPVQQPDNQATLSDIWHDILFNDFHDILPGSCTEPAEQDALDLYGRAMENIRRLNMQSITAINQASEPLRAHIPVTVFNSNQELTTFPVEFECMSDYRPFWEGEWVLKLYDRQGIEVPSQEEQPEARLPFHRWRRKISFLACDLSFGVHHFYLQPQAIAAPLPSAEIHASAPTPSFPRRGQGEVLGQGQARWGLSFLVVADTADSWGTNTWEWRKVEGQFQTTLGEQMIEQGPVRTIHESILTFNHSEIVVHRICYEEWSVTEYKIRIQWNEKQKRLKISIPAALENPRLTAQIPGGAEEFPADGQEYVHGTWLIVESAGTPSQTDGKHRLNVAHSGCHGFDFNGKELRLSVLRSAAYCHEQGYDLNNGRSHKYMDLGVHEIRLAIWEDLPGMERGKTRKSSPMDPSSLAEWVSAPPIAWPHLPIG